MFSSFEMAYYTQLGVTCRNFEVLLSTLIFCVVLGHLILNDCKLVLSEVLLLIWLVVIKKTSYVSF